jgi:P4 family phage/plasmid primase-like protien
MAFTRDQYERFWLNELERPTRNGDHLRARCVIHNGNSPTTLSVNLTTGFAHCFKCHGDRQGWSMIEFAQARYGFDRPCAREYVRAAIGELSSPAIAPWRFPFPRPLAITGDDWKLGLLARSIDRYTEFLDNIVHPDGARHPGWQPYALYLYEPIESVKIRYTHKETGEKRMLWLSLTPKGGWARPAKLKRVAPPYKAHTLKGAEEIWLLNGEKAVDRAIEAWGITCTCLPNGEGNWKEEYLAHFSNAKLVLVIIDNDPSGEEHGRIVGGTLAIAKIETRIVRLPGLPEKGDCWDFIESGGTLEAAREAVRLAPIAEPAAAEEKPKPRERAKKQKAEKPPDDGTPPAAIEGPDLTGYDRNDAGNAERLIVHSAGRLHYARQLEDNWLYFAGAYWRAGAIEEAYAPAINAMELLKRQANAKDDSKLWNFANSRQNQGGLRAMIELAKKQLAIDVNQLDRHPYLINCTNGTFDLETDRLREHRPEDLLTHCFPFPYDPTLKPPMLWLRSLDEWFGGNADSSEGDLDRAGRMSEYLQRIVGYLMTGGVEEKAFFIFFGGGNNGKSSCISTVQEIVGEYAVTISPATLTRAHGHNENNSNADIARSKGARAIFAAEPTEGQKFDQSLLKLLTQGEVAITGVFKGRQPFSFIPSGKLILETNTVPAFDSQDRPFLDRMHLVHFCATFPVSEGHSRREQLRTERAQIFNWAIEGARRWRHDGLMRPEESRAQLRVIRDEQARNDGLEPFLEEFFEVRSGLTCTLAQIETLYRPWCERNKMRPIQRNRLSRLLCERTGITHDNAKDRSAPARLKGLAPKSALPARQDWYKDGTDND